jgi:glycine hydroxymethyltransferase
MCNIACNKNTVPGDASAMNPGGLRMGTPALTTRGFKTADMARVIEMVDKGIKIAHDIQDKVALQNTT